MVCCRRGVDAAGVSVVVRGNAPVQSHPQEHSPRIGRQHRPLPTTPTRLPLCGPRQPQEVRVVSKLMPS